jgi:hypothetical protein
MRINHIATSSQALNPCQKAGSRSLSKFRSFSAAVLCWLACSSKSTSTVHHQFQNGVQQVLLQSQAVQPHCAMISVQYTTASTTRQQQGAVKQLRQQQNPSTDSVKQLRQQQNPSTDNVKQLRQQQNPSTDNAHMPH